MVKNSVTILSRKKLAGWMETGWVGDGWMDGWVDGWESGFKECLQQSKKKKSEPRFELLGRVNFVPDSCCSITWMKVPRRAK